MRNVNSIQETARTIADLAENTKVPNTKQILKLLREEIGEFETFAPTLSFLVVARHETTRKILETELDKEFQVIELGAGFSPHCLNYSDRFAEWIEVDFEENSSLKKIIIQKLMPSRTQFVSGDIYEISTWNTIKRLIDKTKPVFVFCEGVVSHYATEEQKDMLAGLIRPLMINSRSRLYLDDTLKNHPELDKNPIVSQARELLNETLIKTTYSNLALRHINTERLRWNKRGFSVSLIPYESPIEEYRSITSKLTGLNCRLAGVENE